MVRILRPAPDEFPSYQQEYVRQVHGDDGLAALEAQRASTAKLLMGLPETKGSFRYAAGKWSVRELVLHVSDTERVFAYRLMRFARGDDTALPGFDEDAYAANSGAERRTLGDLVAELVTVRAATLVLVASLDEVALARTGTANGHRFTVRSIPWVIAGHEAHHVRILRERYL